jgi:hypothetical protein
MKELFAVANLGFLKVYKFERVFPESKPTAQLVEVVETAAHKKMRDIITDEAGRFHGNQKWPSSRAFGENHDLFLEYEKRSLKRIACAIESYIKCHEDCDCWHLAASNDILPELMNHLSADARARLGCTIPHNLVNSSKLELICSLKDALEARKRDLAQNIES